MASPPQAAQVSRNRPIRRPIRPAQSPSQSLTEIARRRAQQELLRIEHEYHVEDDQSAPWTPRLLGAVPVFGAFGTKTLTLTEGRLLDNLTRDRGLLGLQTFKSIVEDALAEAQRRMPPGSSADVFNDGHGDAFRHCYWNARLSIEFGEAWTRAFCTAHEARAGNEALSEAMDLYNNEVGRAIAAANPHATPAALSDLVLAALTAGRLVVITRQGHLDWSNNVAIGATGRTLPATVPGRITVPDGATRPDYR